jgi:hypothetical protein
LILTSCLAHLWMLVPLSLKNSLGHPWRVCKPLTNQTNSFVDNEWADSRWVALVTKQTIKQTQILMGFDLLIVSDAIASKGLAKLMAQASKAFAC